MCRLNPNARPSTVRASAMIDFAQELLTSHPAEAAQAFSPLVELLDELLADAKASGAIRPDLDTRRLAGVVLQATMFDPFAQSISGSISGATSGHDVDADADAHWDVLLRGIGVR